MSAQAIGLGHGTNENDLKPQRGGPNSAHGRIETIDPQCRAAPLGLRCVGRDRHPGRWPGLASGCHVVAEDRRRTADSSERTWSGFNEPAFLNREFFRSNDPLIHQSLELDDLIRSRHKRT